MKLVECGCEDGKELVFLLCTGNSWFFFYALEIESRGEEGMEAIWSAFLFFFPVFVPSCMHVYNIYTLIKREWWVARSYAMKLLF